MKFEWDEEKNQINIEKHGFDFADAHKVFDGPFLRAPDERMNYGEERFIAIGFLELRVVALAYAIRSGNTVRIISMRTGGNK